MFSSRSGAITLALVSVITLIVLKVVVAIITGSISITAQAADSFLDLIAVAIIFFAIRIADQPADEEHPFGHGKIEGVAAIVQAILILSAGGLIISSAVHRIIVGSKLELTEAGIGVMLVSIVTSLFLSRHLLKISRKSQSIALEAMAHNIAADVYSATGVLLALVLIRLTSLSIFDPIVALIVTLFLLKAAYDIMQKSFGELVDVRLPQVEEEEIISCITEHSGQLAGFHKVRTRRAGGQRFIDLHLMLPKNASLAEAHQMCDHLEDDIESRLPNSSVTIHVEPCEDECDQCLVTPCSLRLGITFRKTRTDIG